MAVYVPDRAAACKTGQALLQKKYMVSVRGSGQQEEKFEDTTDRLFRLLEDDPHSALNAGQTATCSPIQGRSLLGQAPSRLKDSLLSLGFDTFGFDLKELKGGLDGNHTFITHHLREATIIIIIHVHLCNG